MCARMASGEAWKPRAGSAAAGAVARRRREARRGKSQMRSHSS